MRTGHELACLWWPALLVLTAAAAGADPGGGPGSAAAPATAPAEAKAQLRGLSLSLGEPRPDAAGSVHYSGGVSTHLFLLLTSPAATLLAFDADASRLTTVTDDRGTDLLQQADANWRGWIGFHVPEVAKDGAAALLEFAAPSLPAKGAQEITVHGVLVFQAASQQKTVEQKNVALQVGSTIDAGPLALEITRRDKPFVRPGIDHAKMKLGLTLHCSQDMSDIVSIVFLDAAGHAIESSEVKGIIRAPSGGGPGVSPHTGSSPGMTTDQMVISWTINLAQAPDSATVKIRYWSDRHEIKVPVDAKAGLGL